MTQEPNSKNAKQVVKKFLILGVMTVACLGCLWWIFSPSAAEREEIDAAIGFNSDIPDPRGDGIVDDKTTAYEQEQLRLREEEKRREIERYEQLFGAPDETPEEKAAREEMQFRMAPKPPEYYENPERFQNYSSTPPRQSGSGGGRSSSGGGGVGGSYRSSAVAYNDINRTLGNFYEEPEDDAEKEELKAEVERLSNLVRERQAAGDELALLERSYQLASKLSGEQERPADAAPGRKEKVEGITQVKRQVVSQLSAPVSDAEMLRRLSENRNRSFNTVGAEAGDAVAKNTISAVVHGEQTLIDGQTVRLRTVEDMRAGRHLIPRNTIITGVGKITGERLEVAITHIESDGNIIPVEMAVYDSDGQLGIHIPGSMEVEAAKEIAGNMGQSLSTTINLNQQSAGEQLLTDLGRGVIQGTSQLISKKAKQVRVKLKAGYRLFLLPDTNS